MALPYHSIENACAPVAAGIWAVSFIDPQDLAEDEEDEEEEVEEEV